FYYSYSFSNVFVLRTVSIWRTLLSINSLSDSKNGGKESFSPSVSYGSSSMNPGPSVANSNKICGAKIGRASCRERVEISDGIRDRNVTGVQTCALPIFFIIHILFQMFLYYELYQYGELCFRSILFLILKTAVKKVFLQVFHMAHLP